MFRQIVDEGSRQMAGRERGNLEAQCAAGNEAGAFPWGFLT